MSTIFGLGTVWLGRCFNKFSIPSQTSLPLAHFLNSSKILVSKLFCWGVPQLTYLLYREPWSSLCLKLTLNTFIWSTSFLYWNRNANNWFQFTHSIWFHASPSNHHSGILVYAPQLCNSCSQGKEYGIHFLVLQGNKSPLSRWSKLLCSPQYQHRPLMVTRYNPRVLLWSDPSFIRSPDYLMHSQLTFDPLLWWFCSSDCFLTDEIWKNLTFLSQNSYNFLITGQLLMIYVI